MPSTILILPGFQNSGASHWQTIWEARFPNAVRVQQRDWDAPKRSEWVAAVDAAIQNASGPVILVAHSLGCATTAWWFAQHGHAVHVAKISGALLVAPPNVERTDIPDCIEGFAPMPRLRLPFRSIVVASSNDPWCALPKAQSWARDWGASFHDIGARGHINADSDLGDWAQGRAWLAELQGLDQRTA